MAYIYAFIAAAFLFGALHYFTQLQSSQKIYITLLVLLAVLGAVGYNQYSAAKREQMLNVIVKYKQGKTVQCNGKDVNSSQYSLSIGTYTFIGKKDTPHYAEMISAADCK